MEMMMNYPDGIRDEYLSGDYELAMDRADDKRLTREEEIWGELIPHLRAVSLICTLAEAEGVADPIECAWDDLRSAVDLRQPNDAAREEAYKAQQRHLRKTLAWLASQDAVA